MTTTEAVDLFAGLGGFTLGAEDAGVRVRMALNHWQDAVELHERNHPGVVHVTQDAMQYDFTLTPDHSLLLAAPACQGSSCAGQPGRARKQGRARTHDKDRNTAWAVVFAAEVCRPRTIVVENVPQMRRWALWDVWLSAFQALGYSVRCELFDCADFGVPQRRSRIVVTMRHEGEAPRVHSPQLAHVPASSFVQLGLPDAPRRWKRVKDAAEQPGNVIARGRADGLGDTFLIHYGWKGHRGRSLDLPIRTITTKVHWGLVEGDRYRMLTVDELRAAMGFPADYQVPSHKVTATRMLGNAIPPPFARAIVEAAA